MTYQNDDRLAVVRHIQVLLRSLQINSGMQVTVPADGIYGKSTKEAVQFFQRENGLNSTGNVDRATYDLLYELATKSELESEEPLPLFLLRSGKNISKGENSDTVMILQILLNTLTVAYDDYEPLNIDGAFGSDTEKAVRRFQMRNNLSPSGEINKATWNLIIQNYSKHIKNS